MYGPTVDEFKERVGSEVFDEACRVSLALAPGTGSLEEFELGRRTNRAALDSILTELGRDDWSRVPDGALVAFFAALYREMPSYALMVWLWTTRPYAQWDGSSRQAFWDLAREMLSSDRAELADPFAYTLWCDFFEDRARVEESWNELIVRGRIPNATLLDRVLAAAGPVPFPLKEPVLKQLVSNKRRHAAIFQCILGSAFDHFGKVDRDKAARLLERLDVPRDQKKNAKLLKAKLASP